MLVSDRDTDSFAVTLLIMSRGYVINSITVWITRSNQFLSKKKNSPNSL